MNRESQQGLFTGILLGIHLSSEMRMLLSSGYGVGPVAGREGRGTLRRPSCFCLFLKCLSSRYPKRHGAMF